MKKPKNDIPLMLVDDEPGIRNVLGIALRDKGYSVQTAQSGQAALDLMDKNQPWIVLTDIKMPGMDGIELLKNSKRIMPDCEVIMITGHGDMDLAIQSLKSGAIDFITKPINETFLDIALQRARERINMQIQLRTYTHGLEKMVESKTQQLMEAERMAAVGETIAELSHTIKNIASGLKGGAFVVEKGIELDQRPYLLEGWEMVRANVAKIERLSLDLLNYAKTAKVTPQWCCPNKPVKEIAALMAPSAEEDGITLESKLNDDQPHSLFDPDAIHTALLNLVTNAIDACQGRPNAKVRILVGKTRENGITYRVMDNGCGMSPDVRRQLFRKFFSTKGDHGTGIGLMMTHHIVEKHGGTIDVRTREGVGSEFTLNLPAIPHTQNDNCREDVLAKGGI